MNNPPPPPPPPPVRGPMLYTVVLHYMWRLDFLLGCSVVFSQFQCACVKVRQFVNMEPKLLLRWRLSNGQSCRIRTFSKRKGGDEKEKTVLDCVRTLTRKWDSYYVLEEETGRTHAVSHTCLCLVFSVSSAAFGNHWPYAQVFP